MDAAGGRVAVLGAGKMGEALLAGMLRGGTAPSDVLVTARRPERAAELRERHGVEVVSSGEAAARADTLILTVKPQDMAALLAELAPHTPPSAAEFPVTDGSASWKSAHPIATRPRPVTPALP